MQDRPNKQKAKFHKSPPHLKSPKLREKYGLIKKMQNLRKAKEIFGEYFIRRHRNRMCRFYAERCRLGEIPKKRKDVYDVHVVLI